MKKLSEKMIEAYNSGTFGVLVDSFVSDTQKLERELITMKDCNCPQSLGLIELDETRVREIEKLKSCNVRLRAKIGELESKSFCDDETIDNFESELGELKLDHQLLIETANDMARVIQGVAK